MKKLQNVILTQNNRLFCYRKDSNIYRTPEVIDCGGFCNLFPAAHWYNHTNLKKIKISVNIKGQSLIKIKGKSFDGKNYTLVQRKFVSDSEYGNVFLECDLTKDIEYIYLKIVCLSIECELCDAFFFTDEIDCLNNVFLHIVICTYKKENLVSQNVKKILNFIDEWGDNCPVDCVVIDNANSLELDKHSSLEVIANKFNAGGSGGFARGILSVYEKNIGSHILLMDDDIVFESESIFRMLAYLAFAKDVSQSVGGVMLRLEEPHIIQEWGSQFPGHPVPNHSGKNVIDYGGLSLNSNIDYCAWTWFCFPVSTKQLPLPFFIRCDDSEFGLRDVINTVVLPSVMVWHHSFSSDSALVRYLSLRNELIINCLYPNLNRWAFFRLFGAIFYFCMLYRYATAQLALEAINDFLKGPAFWVNTDYEKLEKKFAEWPEHGAKPTLIKYDAENFSLTMRKKSGLFGMCFSLLTANGHFLPSDGKWRHASALNGEYALVKVFRAKSVFYWNKDRQTGYEAKKSLINLFKIFLRTSMTFVKFVFLYPRTKQKFRAQADFLRSEAFWRTYLNI